MPAGDPLFVGVIDALQIKLMAASRFGGMAPGSASATRVFCLTMLHFRPTHAFDWLLIAAYASMAVLWVSHLRASR